jgi:hypothetical protein
VSPRFATGRHDAADFSGAALSGKVSAVSVRIIIISFTVLYLTVTGHVSLTKIMFTL